MATLQDRFNINSQLEHLQAKYIGTGHADLQRFEWAGGELTACLWVMLVHTMSRPCLALLRTSSCGSLVCPVAAAAVPDIPTRTVHDQMLHRWLTVC